ncbi:hypothetical protein [Novosphingobium sp. Chol11]|uniref:hypothetical protein n=1 Tax=Novosphingobium sp. Chol11 TaxID=1385763 RepID=UPI0025FF9547|nr:hypothetical protein [Novosphingobium sp. Chol11]
MPTCSWIREKDSDAFYAALESVPSPGGERAPSWQCPFCAAIFPKAESFRLHLEGTHTGRRPFVTFGGAEPKSTDVIRQRIDSKSVAIFDTTRAYLSRDHSTFSEIALSKVAGELARNSDGRLWIRLKNQFDANADPIHTEYDLSFRVYDDDAKLKRVDLAFVKTLGKDGVTMDDVDAFIRQTEDIAVPEYSAAMADYVIGVLVKDGDPATGIRAATRDYGSRYEGALTVLREFARPLPRLLCSLIRFSRNDFALGHMAATGFGLLDSANAQLSPLAHKGGRWTATKPTPASDEKKMTVCPVDNGSAAVLWRAGQLAATARWSRDLEAQLHAEADVPNLDPEDRQKFFALWAATAHRLGKKESAIYPLRNLAGSYCFGQWADMLLEEIDR